MTKLHCKFEILAHPYMYMYVHFVPVNVEAVSEVLLPIMSHVSTVFTAVIAVRVLLLHLASPLWP